MRSTESSSLIVRVRKDLIDDLTMEAHARKKKSVSALVNEILATHLAHRVDREQPSTPIWMTKERQELGASARTNQFWMILAEREGALVARVMEDLGTALRIEVMSPEWNIVLILPNIRLVAWWKLLDISVPTVRANLQGVFGCGFATTYVSSYLPSDQEMWERMKQLREEHSEAKEDSQG
jgi:hypothetical protein